MCPQDDLKSLSCTCEADLLKYKYFGLKHGSTDKYQTDKCSRLESKAHRHSYFGGVNPESRNEDLTKQSTLKSKTWDFAEAESAV